jgi:hypothetical protein
MPPKPWAFIHERLNAEKQLIAPSEINDTYLLQWILGSANAGTF